jgi:predicted DNA-binding protein
MVFFLLTRELTVNRLGTMRLRSGSSLYRCLVMSSPIFGARIPDDLRLRLENYMTETGRSKSELLIEALGKYLDGLDGVTNAAAGVSPVWEQRLAELEERLAAMEEILLEEYIEPQPRCVRQLRPVRTGMMGIQRR